MTSGEFRRIALGFPETSEHEHMGHPDFRVGGKIFATMLYPDNDSGMVKLTAGQQHDFIASDPAAFRPVTGAWGRRGCTNVRLSATTAGTARRALEAAWRNAGPKSRAAGS